MRCASKSSTPAGRERRGLSVRGHHGVSRSLTQDGEGLQRLLLERRVLAVRGSRQRGNHLGARDTHGTERVRRGAAYGVIGVVQGVDEGGSGGSRSRSDLRERGDGDATLSLALVEEQRFQEG